MRPQGVGWSVLGNGLSSEDMAESPDRKGEKLWQTTASQLTARPAAMRVGSVSLVATPQAGSVQSGTSKCGQR